MSGAQTRHLYNNLCNFPGCTFLEIGCWKGSSTVSAMHGNDATAVVVDNWSEFGGPKDDFFANVKMLLPGHVAADRIGHVDKDCWEALAEMTPADKFSVYLYDGGHSESDHRRAVTEALPHLASPCIFIVDDWSWPKVRAGTEAGLRDSGVEIAYFEERTTTFEDKDGYWNGVGVFVITV